MAGQPEPGLRQFGENRGEVAGAVQSFIASHAEPGHSAPGRAEDRLGCDRSLVGSMMPDDDGDEAADDSMRRFGCVDLELDGLDADPRRLQRASDLLTSAPPE